MKKLICKLNAKNMNTSGGGGGGHGALRPEDLAGGLAYCRDPLASGLLRLKYADHKGEFSKVCAGLEQRLRALGAKKNWAAKKDEVWGRVAKGALLEFCYQRCNFKWEWQKPSAEGCEGRGHLLNERNVDVECPLCKGTGHYVPFAAKRARALGITPNNFTKTWAERWDAALSELSSIESVGLSEASNGLG